MNISLPGGTLFTDVFFVDSKEGWITTTTMASSDLRVTWSPLLYTRDGGKSWYLLASPPDKWLKRLNMKDRHEGWLLGSQELYNTNDGGRTWNLLLETGGDLLVDFFITDNNRIFALTYSGSVFAMRFTDELFRFDKYELKAGEIPGEIKEIGKNIQYSSQCIRGDLFVGAEYIQGEGTVKQFIIFRKLESKASIYGEKHCDEQNKGGNKKMCQSPAPPGRDAKDDVFLALEVTGGLAHLPVGNDDRAFPGPHPQRPHRTSASPKVPPGYRCSSHPGRGRAGASLRRSTGTR